MPDDGLAHAFKTATLADVLGHLDADNGLPSIRRRDLASAVRRTAELLGRPPGAISADVAELRRALATIHPARVGISAKTWQNLRANLLAAVRQAGITRASTGATISRSWRALRDALPDKRMRTGLSRFITYCSNVGIEPDAVDDQVIGTFMAHLIQETFAARPREIHRRTTRLWNEAADSLSGWPRRHLSVPESRQPRTSLPLEAFPSPFVRDVEAHLDWLAGSDPFCGHPPPKPCKPRTIAHRRKQIELAASAYVARGHDVGDITSLADLVDAERVKEVLRFYLEKNANQPTQFLRDLAKALILIARHWVRVDADHLVRLKDLRHRLGSDRSGLTDKNRAMLRQFDDPATRRLLLDLPVRLFAEAERGSDRRAAVAAQIAIAIEILLMAPIRMNNLIALRLDKHLVRPGGSHSLYHLVLHDDETKNGEPIEFELPRHLTDMIDRYLDRFRIRLSHEDCPWLFPSATGGRKAQATLSQQVVETIAKRTGIVITPHQFRHLAAYIFLDAEPGNFEAVRRILGHRNMKTTTSFYAGLQTRSAARLYDAIVLGERRMLRETTKRRPTR